MSDRARPSGQGELFPIGAVAGFDLADPVLVAAAWSRLAEPGDLAAGAAVAALGGRAALELVLAGRPLGEPRLAAAVQRWRARASGLDPARDVALIRSLGGDVLHPGDSRWPEALRDLGEAAPHCLWTRGDPTLLAAARDGGVAVVGARASTNYGAHVATEVVAALASEGRVIVSGGAFGIDAVAHRVALAAGGATVAVMAGGLDRFYPAAHAELLARVAREGCVVAEVPPGCTPSRFRFLTRNRLIAALPAGCVVIEAGWRSGTLSTANHASALLRPVGAVPGPVTSVASAGCHRLIREGQAVCVCDADQVRELLAPLGEAGPRAGSGAAGAGLGGVGAGLGGVGATEGPVEAAGWAGGLPPGLEERERRLWDALPARASAAADSVARVAGLAPSEARSALGRLVLLGFVEEDQGRYRRTPPRRR